MKRRNIRHVSTARFAVIATAVLALAQRPVASFSLSSKVTPVKSHRWRSQSAPRMSDRSADPLTSADSRGSILDKAAVIDVVAIKKLERLPERTLFQGALASLAIVTTAAYDLELASVPVAASLLALVASVVMVSVGTAAVEQLTAFSVPPFDPNSQRFDQTQFGGRFCRMLLGCDPRLLLYNEAEVRQCQSLVQNFASAVDGTKETDRILWEAKRIADSALHPETDEWIPRAFRMSGYLPFNGPICVAMVAAHSTLPLLFWSWLNQSQNALVNYYNRNASSHMSAGTVVRSYAIAVGSALVVAFGLSTYINGHFEGEELNDWLRFISFPSAVIASSLNCYIVRRPEIESGVPLLNEKMENVLLGERSVLAAKRGVYTTTASRAVLQMPTFFIPPLILDTVEPLKRFLEENPPTMVPITTFLLLLSFGIGLPCAVGIFPQMSRIGIKEVESKFEGLGYSGFYFNKGL